MKQAVPEENPSDTQTIELRRMGRGIFRSSTPIPLPKNALSWRPNESALVELGDRLQRCDRTEVEQSLALSAKALQARLDGHVPFDASQLIVVASLAGLRASELV